MHFGAVYCRLEERVILGMICGLRGIMLIISIQKPSFRLLDKNFLGDLVERLVGMEAERSVVATSWQRQVGLGDLEALGIVFTGRHGGSDSESVSSRQIRVGDGEWYPDLDY